MRKKVLIGIGIILSVLLCTACVTFVFQNNKHRENHVNIMSSTVNNRYNNTKANISTKVVQIDNKIYYYCTFGGNPFDYGLYEIESGSAKRLYWDGFLFHPYGFNLDDVYKNKILRQADSDDFFNTDTGEYEDGKKYTIGEGDYVSFIKDDCRYFVSEHELVQYDDTHNTCRVLATAEELQMKDFFLNSLNNFYLNDDCIIYQTRIDESVYICCFDMHTKQIRYKYSLNEIPDSQNGVGGLIANKDDVFFMIHDTLYHVNMDKQTIDKLFICSNSLRFNSFANHLILGVGSGSAQSGIYIIDLGKSYEAKRICNIPVDSVYIFDEEYVYFTDENYHLYRSTLDGNKLEKVFF